MAGQHFTDREGYVYKEAASRTTNFTGDAIPLGTAKGLKVYCAISQQNTISQTYKIQYLDPNDETTWVDLLSSAAKTNTGNFTLTVAPGVATVSNEALGNIAPRICRVVTSGTLTSITDAIFVELID